MVEYFEAEVRQIMSVYNSVASFRLCLPPQLISFPFHFFKSSLSPISPPYSPHPIPKSSLLPFSPHIPFRLPSLSIHFLPCGRKLSHPGYLHFANNHTSCAPQPPTSPGTRLGPEGTRELAK